jgi:hypothetical protein
MAAGQRAGCRVVAVRPDQQFAGGASEEPLKEGGAVASAPGIRINDEFRFGGRDDGGRDVANRDEFAGSRAQVDEALVGERRLSVGVAGAPDQAVKK